MRRTATTGTAPAVSASSNSSDDGARALVATLTSTSGGVDSEAIRAVNNDTTGALRAIDTITTGLQWRRVQAPVTVVGNPSNDDLDACWELGAAVAAGLTMK